MRELQIYVIAGFAGGVARGLTGFLKKNKRGGGVKFDFPYFFTTVFFSGILGGIAGALAESSWKTALLAGYAGIDFLENMYKSSPLSGLLRGRS